jgi:hypothetical protein
MSCILSIILLSVTIHIHNHDLASSVHTCIYIGGNRVNVQISLHRKTTKAGGDLPTNGAIGKTLNRDFYIDVTAALLLQSTYVQAMEVIYYLAEIALPSFEWHYINAQTFANNILYPKVTE